MEARKVKARSKTKRGVRKVVYRKGHLEMWLSVKNVTRLVGVSDLASTKNPYKHGVIRTRVLTLETAGE
jgi:hypothetical protein